MALFGTVKTLRQQLAQPDHFAAAFHYLEQALDPGSEVHARIRAITPGETVRVPLADGAFALEQVYRTKPRSEGRFEAHAAHVDLQAVIAGAERMEVVPVERLTLVEDAFEERDVAFFADAPGGSSWRVEAGEVAVFFPADAHLPSVAVAEPALVYKTVVKVPVPA